ncbi:hypothetical protein B0H13DRAFT_1855881 [Mycena leptocephala]|nr:hypothetical protein B0H13DRAFT_1855881 [Mycena leptocephala]
MVAAAAAAAATEAAAAIAPHEPGREYEARRQLENKLQEYWLGEKSDLWARRSGWPMEFGDGRGPPGREVGCRQLRIFMRWPRQPLVHAFFNSNDPLVVSHNGGTRPGRPRRHANKRVFGRTRELAAIPMNMTHAEMIPDTHNPTHDPRFWCLPPVRDIPSETGRSGKFPMTIVNAMVIDDGSGSAAPPIKVTPGPSKTKGRPVEPGLQAHLQLYCMPDLSGLSLAAPAAEVEDDCLTAESLSVSSTSSVTATTWAALPKMARYYAIWGEGIWRGQGSLFGGGGRGVEPPNLVDLELRRSAGIFGVGALVG